MAMTLCKCVSNLMEDCSCYRFFRVSNDVMNGEFDKTWDKLPVDSSVYTTSSRCFPPIKTKAPSVELVFVHQGFSQIFGGFELH